jgi:hypothetical protein
MHRKCLQGQISEDHNSCFLIDQNSSKVLFFCRLKVFESDNWPQSRSNVYVSGKKNNKILTVSETMQGISTSGEPKKECQKKIGHMYNVITYQLAISHSRS